MRILFSHCNYPAQFRRLAPALAADGHDVHFLFKNKEWHATPPDGIFLHRYPAKGARNHSAVHPYIRKFDEAVAEGQNSFRAAKKMQNEGWEPDVIISHAGFGNGLYLSDVFPKAARVGLFEWFYKAEGSDVEFLEHGNINDDKKLRLRTWNAQLLLEFIQCDAVVCPTAWQRHQFPLQLQEKISTIHEGIDAQGLSMLRAKRGLRPEWLPESGQNIISYVSRGFEEYRGFQQAMEACALIQADKPDVHVVIAGSDSVCYGSPRRDGRSWQEWATTESGLDSKRTTWLGSIGTEKYQTLLTHTDVHLYLTVPFILSWSLLEAMATGCPIVSSATAPVQEVMTDGYDGILKEFWNPKQIAKGLAYILENPENAAQIGKKAQLTASRFDAAKGLEQWRSLISAATSVSHQT